MVFGFWSPLPYSVVGYKLLPRKRVPNKPDTPYLSRKLIGRPSPVDCKATPQSNVHWSCPTSYTIMASAESLVASRDYYNNLKELLSRPTKSDIIIFLILGAEWYETATAVDRQVISLRLLAPASGKKTRNTYLGTVGYRAHRAPTLGPVGRSTRYYASYKQ